MLLKVFNDMVPGIGVECVCLSGAMLAKAGTVLVLDVCLVGGKQLRSRGMCEFWFSRIISVDRGAWILGRCARAVLAASCSVGCSLPLAWYLEALPFASL